MPKDPRLVSGRRKWKSGVLQLQSTKSFKGGPLRGSGGSGIPLIIYFIIIIIIIIISDDDIIITIILLL